MIGGWRSAFTLTKRAFSVLDQIRPKSSGASCKSMFEFCTNQQAFSVSEL